MRTYIFTKPLPANHPHANQEIVGVLVCNNHVVFTPQQKKKLMEQGINIVSWYAESANHEGDMNRHVDTLMEIAVLGRRCSEF